VRHIRPLLGNRTYTVRRGIIKGLRRRGGLGFIPFGAISKEEAFLSGLDLSGQTIYDVGGWEGVYALFFAMKTGAGGRVVTFEPNPANFAILQHNLRLNGFDHVQALPIALGASSQPAILVANSAETGTGSIYTGDRPRPYARSGAQAIQVEMDTLDHVIAQRGLPSPDLVKIDVEGMEGDVLAGMSQTLSRWRPRLHIEVHRIGAADASARQAEQLIRWLIARRYALWHVELGIEVDESRAGDCVGHHIFCRPEYTPATSE
jgi:FkbM family methyltransferase